MNLAMRFHEHLTKINNKVSKTKFNKKIKKIKELLILSVLFFSTTSYAYNWQSLMPFKVHVNNVSLNIGSEHKTIVCTSNGIYVNDNSFVGWSFYNIGGEGLPVWEAIELDSANILVVMGNGTNSDGIYKFNLLTMEFSIVELCLIPTFIKFNPHNNLYYVGTRYSGLLYSSNGTNWFYVPYFSTATEKSATAIDFYNEHITVVQENNTFATYYSNDDGNTWNKSTSNIPIHDLAFDNTGKLYGVYTPECTFPIYKFANTVKFSSGLFSSPDYGETWNIEASAEYINTVNIDFSGNVFAGWHNSPNLAESSEGIAKFDTTSHEFTFINNGLPNKNINKIKFELGFLGCYIYMYCCTDSGVYYTNNYLTEINDINNSSAFAISNYPNPFNSFTTFEYTISEKLNTNISFVIYDLQGQKIKEFPYLNRSEGNYTLEFDASSLKSGIYCYILRAGNNIISRKINCIK